jgi:hypothetical protein
MTLCGVVIQEFQYRVVIGKEYRVACFVYVCVCVSARTPKSSWT